VTQPHNPPSNACPACGGDVSAFDCVELGTTVWHHECLIVITDRWKTLLKHQQGADTCKTYPPISNGGCPAAAGGRLRRPPTPLREDHRYGSKIVPFISVDQLDLFTQPKKRAASTRPARGSGLLPTSKTG
jgi:hypothetical protein